MWVGNLLAVDVAFWHKQTAEDQPRCRFWAGVMRTSQARSHRIILPDDDNSDSVTATAGSSANRQHGQWLAPSPTRHRHHHDAQTTDTSVEQLSVPLITAIASAIACLINRDTLADIKPSFENDTNIVATPPPESALSNRVKIVERDVEIYRKQAQSI
jgi:hypothetical protein